MKKILSLLTVLIFVAVLSVNANGNKPDVHVIDKSKAKVVLEDYEKNWSKRGSITSDDADLNKILKERGVEGDIDICKTMVYTKDGINKMIMIAESGSLYEFAVNECDPYDGTAPAHCGCDCGGCNGHRPLDINGDGDCLDKWECIWSCVTPEK